MGQLRTPGAKLRWKAMTEMQYSMGSELGELGLVDEDMEDGRG